MSVASSFCGSVVKQVLISHTSFDTGTGMVYGQVLRFFYFECITSKDLERDEVELLVEGESCRFSELKSMKSHKTVVA